MSLIFLNMKQKQIVMMEKYVWPMEMLDQGLLPTDQGEWKCVSLYGCVLWSLFSPDIVAMNHHLRRIWKLPRNSHTAVCHCLGQVPAIRNILLKRFTSFCKSTLSSSSPLVVLVFSDSCFLPYTFTGYNNTCGYQHIKLYSDHDMSSASTVHFIRYHFGFWSPFESTVYELSTS